MRTSNSNLCDLRDFFLDKEGGSPEILGSNLARAIKLSDGWHNHAIFLYHATKNAMHHKTYGADPDVAADVIHKQLRAWSDKALTLKGTPEPWVIPQTLTAFSMLRVMPPAKYVEFCQSVALRSLRRWPKTPLLEWSSLSGELTLDQNKEFLGRFCDRLVSLATTMRGDELYDLARNLATMDAVMAARGSQSGVLGETFRKIFNNPALLPELKLARATEEPQKLGDAVYWFSRQKAACQRSTPECDSGLQFMVASQFKAVGAQPVRRHVVKDTGHELDLTFSFNGCVFDVEVDGPVHFIRSTSGHIITLDGRSVFQTLLMREKAPERKIVRLPYTVFQDHADRTEVWHKLCEDIKDAEPGAFMVDTQGSLTADLLVRCQSYPLSSPDRNSAGERTISPP